METAVHARQATAAGHELPLVVRFRPAIELSEDQFFELCQINHELRIERNAQGELLIMPPAGSETGHRNLEVAVQVGGWAKRDGTGVALLLGRLHVAERSRARAGRRVDRAGALGAGP